MVKRLPTRQDTRSQSLGGEEPLEKEPHSSILAWEIPWTEEPGGYSLWGHRVGRDRATSLSLSPPLPWSMALELEELPSADLSCA